MTSCVVCSLIYPIEQLSREYAIDIFNALAPDCLSLFAKIMIVWLVYSIGIGGYLGSFKFKDFFKKLILMLITLKVLQDPVWVWKCVFDPFQQIIINISKAILQKGVHDRVVAVDQTGYVGVADAMLQEVWELAGKIVSWNPIRTGFCFVVWLIFIFSVSLGVVFVVEFIFTLFMIQAFAAFYVMAFDFESTRIYTKRAFHCMLSGAFTMLFSMMALSLFLIIYDMLFNGVSSSGVKVEGVADLNWGTDWLRMMLLAVLLFLVQTRVKNFSANLFGISDGAGMSSLVAGLMTMAVGAAFMKGGAMVASGVGKLEEMTGIKGSNSKTIPKE